MALRIEELDATDTPIGVISLRRRFEPVVGEDVYEVKIDDEFLMSSLFTVVEQELAHLGLARLGDTGGGLHVLVGGLGLGFTLRAALEDERVRQVQVIEAVEAVIGWHRRDLLPRHGGAGRRPALRARPRRLLRARGGQRHPATVVRRRAARRRPLAAEPAPPQPRRVLHRGRDGATGRDPRPGGVFGLWSDDPPDPAFEAVLDEVFEQRPTRRGRFANPLTGGESASTVYVATI